MRKICFLFLIIPFASCSMDENWEKITESDATTLLGEAEDVIYNYELALKGYSIEELSKEKDESPSLLANKVETVADSWIIQAIQDSLAKVSSTYSCTGKTRTDTRAVGRVNNVGVFKYATCGDNREFVFYMDCEDGGDTRAIGDVGATIVNGNVTFKFCLVSPANYGGGVLLLYNYAWPANPDTNLSILKRYHDCEDSRNINEIKDDGGLLTTGWCKFSHNATLSWIYFGSPKVGLPFKYGVVNSGPSVGIGNSIWIDDEDSSNANEATLCMYSIYSLSITERKLDEGEYYKGIRGGRNSEYKIQIF